MLAVGTAVDIGNRRRLLGLSRAQAVERAEKIVRRPVRVIAELSEAAGVELAAALLRELEAKSQGRDVLVVHGELDDSRGNW